jgi:hypothetical protein
MEHLALTSAPKSPTIPRKLRYKPYGQRGVEQFNESMIMAFGTAWLDVKSRELVGSLFTSQT